MSKYMGIHIAKPVPPQPARKPPALGSINCFIRTRMEVLGKQLFYDGTSLGMARVAVAAGAKDGDVIIGWISGRPEKYLITAAPHDTQFGFYATEIFE